MILLLDLPDVRKRVQGIPVEGYHRLGELGMLGHKVELLRGIVLAKAPKSPLHELVAQKLMQRLLALVPQGFAVRPEGPLTLRDSEPEPDLSVVQGQPDDWATAHPSTAQLVLEVSVSSRAVDESKAEIYAEAGIAEYWLVRPEDRVVDVYSRPTSGGYFSKVTLSDKESLTRPACRGLAFLLWKSCHPSPRSLELLHKTPVPSAPCLRPCCRIANRPRRAYNSADVRKSSSLKRRAGGGPGGVGGLTRGHH